MKKTFTLILALALLTAGASAQENRLDIRAGRTLSFTSGKAVPGDLALASLASLVSVYSGFSQMSVSGDT